MYRLKLFVVIYLMVVVAAVVCVGGLMLVMTPFGFFDGIGTIGGLIRFGLMMLFPSLVLTAVFLKNKK